MTESALKVMRDLTEGNYDAICDLSKEKCKEAQKELSILGFSKCAKDLEYLGVIYWGREYA